jgi:hypothetical protein
VSGITAIVTDEYERLLDEIGQGVKLHYGDAGVDPDLDLLIGDQRYAQGLVRLAELGDLEATVTLADAISAVAQAQAEGDAARADAAWTQAVAAVRFRRGLR